jgi:hypothetical protein
VGWLGEFCISSLDRTKHRTSFLACFVTLLNTYYDFLNYRTFLYGRDREWMNEWMVHAMHVYVVEYMHDELELLIL